MPPTWPRTPRRWRFVIARSEEAASPYQRKGSRSEQEILCRRSQAPQSAFDFFVGIKKAKVLKENPGITLDDATEKIRALYAELDDDDKGAFEDMEKQDLERYEEESAGKKMDVDDE